MNQQQVWLYDVGKTGTGHSNPQLQPHLAIKCYPLVQIAKQTQSLYPFGTKAWCGVDTKRFLAINKFTCGRWYEKTSPGIAWYWLQIPCAVAFSYCKSHRTKQESSLGNEAIEIGGTSSPHLLRDFAVLNYILLISEPFCVGLSSCSCILHNISVE